MLIKSSAVTMLRILRVDVLVAEVGASQVVLGTDHPTTWEQHPVDHVMNTPSLRDTDRIAILGGNARRLLGLSS